MVCRLGIFTVLCFGLLGAACSSSDDSSDQSKNPSEEKGATETNVARAPCETDGDCPEGIDCVVAEGDNSGFCDVEEHVAERIDGATSATPAPCESDADCPDAIACVFPSGSGGPGFCDVEEHIAP